MTDWHALDRASPPPRARQGALSSRQTMELLRTLFLSLSPQTHCRGLAASTLLFSRHLRKWFDAFFCFLSFAAAAAVPAQAHARVQNRTGGGVCDRLDVIQGFRDGNRQAVYRRHGATTMRTKNLSLEGVDTTTARQQGTVHRQMGALDLPSGGHAAEAYQPGCKYAQVHAYKRPPFCITVINVFLTGSAISPPFTGRVARQISTI